MRVQVRPINEHCVALSTKERDEGAAFTGSSVYPMFAKMLFAECY